MLLPRVIVLIADVSPSYYVSTVWALIWVIVNSDPVGITSCRTSAWQDLDGSLVNLCSQHSVVHDPIIGSSYSSPTMADQQYTEQLQRLGDATFFYLRISQSKMSFYRLQKATRFHKLQVWKRRIWYKWDFSPHWISNCRSKILNVSRVVCLHLLCIFLDGVWILVDCWSESFVLSWGEDFSLFPRIL